MDIEQRSHHRNPHHEPPRKPTNTKGTKDHEGAPRSSPAVLRASSWSLVPFVLQKETSRAAVLCAFASLRFVWFLSPNAAVRVDHGSHGFHGCNVLQGRRGRQDLHPVGDREMPPWPPKHPSNPCNPWFRLRFVDSCRIWPQRTQRAQRASLSISICPPLSILCALCVLCGRSFFLTHSLAPLAWPRRLHLGNSRNKFPRLDDPFVGSYCGSGSYTGSGPRSAESTDFEVAPSPLPTPAPPLACGPVP